MEIREEMPMKFQIIQNDFTSRALRKGCTRWKLPPLPLVRAVPAADLRAVCAWQSSALLPLSPWA